MRNLTREPRTNILTLVSVLIVALGMVSIPASADDLDDAKARGVVGEQLDGYLGLVDSGAPSSVKELVAKINAKRLEKYRGIAEKRGASTEAVAALAGAKLIERSGPGAYVQGADGKWVRK
jgi:uncharacterized protein YdbL (DUF1318 family)